LAVAALVLGIIGMIASLIPFGALLGVPLAIVGLILGILARKNAVETQQPTGMATAGLVVSIIGVALGILLFALCAACVGNAKRNFERMANDPEYQKQHNKDVQEFNEAFKKALEETQKQQKEGAQPQAAPAPEPSGATPAKK
jgi:hypothetical protein